MDVLATYQRVREKFGDQVLEVVEKAHDPFMVVNPAAIVGICRFLRDDPEIRMNCLSSEIGVDYKDRIEVVYELYSYPNRYGVTLKVKLPRENPVIATVEPVWNSANWMEREIFDLIGVTFEGHSDLRRILMPEDWPGHPQRKDFVEPMEYHGISTVRESPIIRLGADKK
jgi:NADH-quinone oxidoreductase subunit C